MPYPKSAEQATFEWMPALPFYTVWIKANICVPESYKRSSNPKQNFVENKLIERDNFLIKSHIAWWKLNPILLVPILMINFLHLG